MTNPRQESDLTQQIEAAERRIIELECAPWGVNNSRDLGAAKVRLSALRTQKEAA